MTFDGGGGFKQSQDQIVATEFTSSNFSNTNHTGFDLNSSGGTDADGTPANTIQVYTGLVVGPPNGNFAELLYNGQAAALAFGTNNPADTGLAGIGADTIVQGGSGRTITELGLTTPRENGFVELVMQPSGGTTASDFPGQVFLTNASATAPAGYDGLKGRLILSADGTGSNDPWELIVQNENSVISSGTTLGHPAVILGDTQTPRSRLYISVSELLSITGAGQTETFYLNTNNTQSVGGGVVNPTMRQQSTVIAGPFTPGTGGYVSVGGIAGIPCPASGTGTVWLRFLVTGNTALTAADFVAGCPNIQNTTQATTPFAATDNRCAQVDGPFLLNASSANIVTVMTQVCATTLGNPLDALTITAQFHQNSNAAGRFFNVSKVEIGWIPSL